MSNAEPDLIRHGPSPCLIKISGWRALAKDQSMAIDALLLLGLPIPEKWFVVKFRASNQATLRFQVLEASKNRNKEVDSAIRLFVFSNQNVKQQAPHSS